MFALIPTDPKTRRFCGWVLLAGVLLGGIGGYVVTRWGVHINFLDSGEPLYFWQHANSERGAKAYLYALEAMEKGSSNDLRRLQQRGYATLFYYVREAEEIKKRYGYPWCPLDRDVFERAQDYLARHPRANTNAKVLDMPK